MVNNITLSRTAALCFDAQTYLGSANEYNNGDFNPDVGDIVITTLLPLLIGLSPEVPPDIDPNIPPDVPANVTTNVALDVHGQDVTPDVTQSLCLLFSQTIPILVSTLASINSDNLSLFDAHFAFAVTMSPTALYVTGSSFSYFCRTYLRRRDPDSTSLFKKIPSASARMLVLGMGIILPCLWLSVGFVTSFYRRAFRNSEYCKDMTFPRFLEFLFVSSFTGALDILGRRDLMDDLKQRKGLGLSLLLWMCLWAVYLVRHRERITRVFMRPIRYIKPGEEGLRIKPLQYLLLVWRIPKASWTIIMAEHPTMFVWLFICAHWSWALGISKALVFDRKQMSYGQLLSLFSPLPVLWALGKILFVRRRADVKRFIKSIPSSFLQGTCFIILGREQWSTSQVNLRRDYFDWSRRRWVLTLACSFLYVAGHAVWITFYVRAGSMPNNRNVTNEPHSHWKPFSVCMFINGYFCSIVCIFLSVAFFDFLRTDSGKKHLYLLERPEFPWPTYNRILSRQSFIVRLAIFISSLVFTVMFYVGPVFVPHIALPLAQEWHWKHDCNSYPVEIILYGQPNTSQAAPISFSLRDPDSPAGLNPPRRMKLYDFTFYTPEGSNQDLRVLEYIEEPELAASKTSYNEFGSSTVPFLPISRVLILDTAQKRFVGCSARFSDLARGSPNTTIEQPGIDQYSAGCSGPRGSYGKEPYLRFTIPNSTSDPTSTVYLQAESKEWAYTNDAPSFSLLKYSSSSRTSSGDSTERAILLRSALTKRNDPTILKVCSNEVDVSVDVLGPLAVVMCALNRFSVFISRPRVLSTV